MNIFIFEYFCGGGDYDSSMLSEGEKMLESAIADFSRIDGVTPYFTSDFDEGVENCDAALIIAPETDGILHRLTATVYDKGKKNLGCSPSAIEIAGDKFAFAKLMEKEGIAHPETCLIDERFDPSKLFKDKWITKPLDGAGSEGIKVWHSPAPSDYKSASGIAQEYIEGDPMSLCVVSSGCESMILSVNRQKLSKILKYRGGEITGSEPDDNLKMLVSKIKSAIPGLKGFWGVDYVAHDSGSVVIEVNPRLTTSYCTLSDALDINPAEIIMTATTDERIFCDITRRGVNFCADGEICKV